MKENAGVGFFVRAKRHTWVLAVEDLGISYGHIFLPSSHYLYNSIIFAMKEKHSNFNLIILAPLHIFSRCIPGLVT